MSNAGGMGIIETSSGELDVIKDEIRKMRDLTDKPFGLNIAQAFWTRLSGIESVITSERYWREPRPVSRAGFIGAYTGSAGGRGNRG